MMESRETTDDEDEAIATVIKLAREIPNVQMAIRKALTLCMKSDYGEIDEHLIVSALPAAIEALRKNKEISTAAHLEELVKQLHSAGENRCDYDYY